MMETKAPLVCLILGLAILVCGCKESTLTKQQIIDIATKKAKAEEVTLDIRQVHYDVRNQAWGTKLTEIKQNSPDYAKSRDYF
ncbi:MAG: hypothetical protein ACYTE5_02380, partial [Planctomycetota bacterium]